MSTDDREDRGPTSNESTPPPPPAAPADLAEARQALADIRERTSAAQKSLEDEKKANLYLQAEFDNFRKQKLREFEELRQFAAERVVSTLLDDMENLQRLEDHAVKLIGEAERAGSDPPTLGRLRSLHEGVQRVGRHLSEAMGATGLKEMAALGVDFDPTMHEALAEESSARCRDQEVLQVFQKGYTMHGRILRPAKVLVGRKQAARAGADPAVPVEHPGASEQVRQNEDDM